MGTAEPTPPRAVQIKRDGEVYTGSFVASRKMITVSYGGRNKTAQLGGSADAPASLAKVILGELVQEEKATKQRGGNA